jgi:tRNA 2-thiocytidine biosynthesis protein TtcA
MLSVQELTNPLATKIRKTMVDAIADFNMLENDDRLLVCVSGGKDSSVLLALLLEIQKKSPVKFHIEAALLDQGHPGFDPRFYKEWIESLGVKFHIISRDTYSIVKEKVVNRIYCSMCSKLRRAILYDFASENGFNKLALGHHREDICETLLMNLFYSGKLATMPPKLKSDDGRHIVIRPLAYVPEKELAILAAKWEVPILPCNLCGSQDGMKRKKTKALLAQMELENPILLSSMIGAMKNVHKSHLLDKKLWDFEHMTVDAIESIPNIEANLSFLL